MERWDIVLVLIALSGFAVSIVTPVVKLNTSITRLTVTMDALGARLDKVDEDNHDSHKRIWDKNAEQDKVLAKHEQRIQKMEEK